MGAGDEWGGSMTTSTVGGHRRLGVALFALVAVLLLSMSEPAFAHDEARRTNLYDRLGNPRGSFSYSHHTGNQNVFALADNRSDGYNVSVFIERKSGSSWVVWKTMSATNQTTRHSFCSVPGGQVKLTLQTWVISDGLSRTETQYWNTTACNH
jgi:hypothetical protein